MNVIAIDGPSSSGKSTIAKNVADKLNVSYITSGYFYRTITFLVVNSNPDLINDQEFIKKILSENKIEYINDLIYVNDNEITSEIKSESLTKYLPIISENVDVRNHVNILIRNIAVNTDIVIDGRDIGTVVFPDAVLKIYLDASVEVRAMRRYEEVKDKGFNYDDIYASILNRDNIDKTRKVAPLKCADDAILIDSTNLSIDEIVNQVIALYKEVV